MIKREIKAFSVELPGGEIYEASIPSGISEGLIAKGIYTLDEVESGKASLPESCTFTLETELSEADTKKKYIFLEVRGVLAKGELFFNGKSCGIINGPHRTYLFEVADKVVVGKNTVEIRCNEKIEPKQRLTRYGERASDYDTALRISDFALLSALALYISDSAFINGVNVRQEHSNGKVSLYVMADTVGDKNDVRIVASLSAPSGKIYFGGAYEDEIKITVADPELWWPRGYGAQPIYKLTVTLYHGAEVADVYEKRIGLRTVELTVNDGSAPALTVNGIKVFARGASYVKENSVVTTVSDASVERAVKSAVSANMNTLTVFDENIPLPDSFYALCDKYGIMVWQSLTVPYIAPPAASVFASGVTDSVRDGIRRLALHPSVAMFFLEFTETSREMMRLFKDAIDEFRGVASKILTPVLSKYAVGIPFVEKTNEIFERDERYLFENDASFADSTLYALPSEYTLKSFIPENDYNLFSYSSETQTNVSHCVKMLDNTVRYMKMPNGMAELIYASEVSAGYALSKSIKRSRGSEVCGSAVLRQLNDGKKTVSSSFIDYLGKTKGTLKYVKEAFAPVCVDVIASPTETSFVISNLSKKEYTGRLFYALYDTKGECYVEKNVSIVLASGLSETVEKADLSRFIGDNGRCFYVMYELYDDNGIVASGSEHFVPIKHVEFCDPEISAEISGMGKKFSIRLNSELYAYAVKVDFGDLDVNFSDNFVNLYGKIPVVIDFETSEVVTLGELENKIKIYSPYSIGR